MDQRNLCCEPEDPILVLQVSGVKVDVTSCIVQCAHAAVGLCRVRSIASLTQARPTERDCSGCASAA